MNYIYNNLIKIHQSNKDVNKFYLNNFYISTKLSITLSIFVTVFLSKILKNIIDIE